MSRQNTKGSGSPSAENPRSESVPLPKVSVVVATRNSAKTLPTCLASIRAQTYKSTEVIVIDNHSSDSTVAVAQPLADTVLIAGPERSSQVNLGAQVAKGSYVYRVGSDFVLDKRVIEEAVLKAERDQLDAIIVHNDSDPSISFWARIRNFERKMYRGDSLNVGARFIRRDVFLSIGGLDEELVAGEDYDLHARLVAQGYKIGRIAACETHMEEPSSLGEIVKKYFYYGRHLRRYVRKHGRHSVYQLSPFRPAFVRNYRQFILHPLLAGGFLFYLAVKYIAGLAGFLTPGRSFGKRSSPPARRSALPFSHPVRKGARTKNRAH